MPKTSENGAQEAPKLIKNAVLSKSKKVISVWEGWSNLRVGGSQHEVCWLFFAFKIGIRNKMEGEVDFLSSFGRFGVPSWNPKSIKL